MRIFTASAIFFIAIGSAETVAQQNSSRICASAAASLGQASAITSDGAVLISTDMQVWHRASSEEFGSNKVDPNASTVFIAYLIAREQANSGALAVRISRKISNENEKTNSVSIYRPEIAQGENPCESRRRREIDRTVTVNQYIDFHESRGINSDLEAFHFHYLNNNKCEDTKSPDHLPVFKFEDVKRTSGSDGVLARNFSFMVPAFAMPGFAINHKFSMLRAELHYRKSVNRDGTCFSFSVPFGSSREMRFVGSEIGFGRSDATRSWMISR